MRLRAAATEVCSHCPHLTGRLVDVPSRLRCHSGHSPAGASELDARTGRGPAAA